MKVLMSAAAAFVLIGGAVQAGDPAAGEKIFDQRCKTCHMIVSPAGETIVRGGKTGPNQWGVVGGKWGHDPEFTRYGAAIKAGNEKGMVWDEASMIAYLEDPRAFLREALGDSNARSNMAYKLPDAQARADVVAYLAQFSH